MVQDSETIVNFKKRIDGTVYHVILVTEFAVSFTRLLHYEHPVFKKYSWLHSKLSENLSTKYKSIKVKYYCDAYDVQSKMDFCSVFQSRFTAHLKGFRVISDTCRHQCACAS